MNRNIILAMLSRIILGAGVVLLLPMLLSLYYGGPVLSFLLPAALSFLLYLISGRRGFLPMTASRPGRALPSLH